MLEFADDILRAADLGRHDRKAMRRSFHQRKPIGLHQRRIDEDPARPRGEFVKRADLFARMRFGIGDPAVQIVPVDRVDKALQHLLLLDLAR